MFWGLDFTPLSLGWFACADYVDPLSLSERRAYCGRPSMEIGALDYWFSCCVGPLLI